MEVRPTRPDEWPALRATRLAALADSPTAYSSTLSDDLAYPEDVWRRWATPGAGHANFAAIVGGTWVGMCAAKRDDGDDLGHLVAMWVDPAYRDRGIGAALIAAAAAWCRQQGIATLHLWVNETNTPAVSLYRRQGFEPTGLRQPLAAHSGHFEIAMSGRIDTGPVA